MNVYLRCRVCSVIQAVTCADEADEDVRTQAIRRAFRADHLAQCGPQSVTLEFVGDPLTVTDAEDEAPPAWTTRDRPREVTLGADGFFSRDVRRDGVTQAVRVCEDCWQMIPRYVDFPAGLTSPESDGDASGNGAKTRRMSVEGRRGTEHLRKAVCLPCYLAAFARVYPGAPVPDLCADVVGDGAPIAVEHPPADEPFASEPGYAAVEA